MRKLKEFLKDENGMEIIQVIFIIAIAAVAGTLLFKFVLGKTNDVKDYTDQQFDFDALNTSGE